MINKKFSAVAESFLMIVSIFSLCHFIGLSEEVFPVASASEGTGDFQAFLDKFNVSESIFANYPKASSASDPGCCLVSVDNQVCGTSAPDVCVGDSPFAEGILCDETEFCEKGCCFDAKEGIYDKNVLEANCGASWIADANCNLPGATVGCCVLGSTSIFETEGQCRTDSLERAIDGDATFDWRSDVDEAGCIALAAVQEEGACVIGRGGCKFVTETDCLSYGGDFYSGLLCTASELNTTCQMTHNTDCVEGKDGVYFLDSCGNPANIYDSSKVDDEDYWQEVANDSDICGSQDFEKGSGGSRDCGNCNRFLGGLCSSASEDGFNVDLGDAYCKDTSCMYKGVNYENGESWCVYDGAIGNGDDVVGSRHWKYVCSQGTIQIEPCADYRNQICVESGGVEVNGKEVGFSNAECVANNWRECLSLNSEDEDALKQCESTLNCRLSSVNVSKYFSFNVCMPKYPGGFDFNSDRYGNTADNLCGMASMNCTVVQKQKTWGGCKYVANEECLTQDFAEQMNDFCRGIGDCGGSANFVGTYSDSYAVKRDGKIDKSLYLSEEVVARLKGLAEAVDGQFAEVEDYSKYLESAGFGSAGAAPGADNKDPSGTISTAASGIGGIGTAVQWAISEGWISGTAAPTIAQAELSTTTYGSSATVSGAGTVPSAAAGFGGAAIGAAMGAVAGLYLAKSLGLAPGPTILMAVGGALIGGVAGYAVMMGGAAAVPIAGWIIVIIAVIIMIIAAMIGGDDCDPIVISFDCRTWEPPYSGGDCEKCNEDPLKPCSEYRCSSLGSRCELTNVGGDEELCVDGAPNDHSPPVISRREESGFEGVDFVDNSNGFKIVGEDNGCVEPYNNLPIALSTNEPAKCSYDVEDKESFDEMSVRFGGGNYVYNHTTVLNLPNPSDLNNSSTNSSIDWSGRVSLFVKCIDRSGLVNPEKFEIDLCVNDGPDESSPVILSGEVGNFGAVGHSEESAYLKVETNEASSCRWSSDDEDYFDMVGEMNCSGGVSSVLHECSTYVPVGKSSQNYYVRCLDQPWEENENLRNVDEESFVLSLTRPDTQISIDSISPSEDFEIGSESTTVVLNIVTSGGGNYHTCSYSFSGYEDMIDILESGNLHTHSQNLVRGEGTSHIYVECRDESGEFDRGETEFTIHRDSSPSAISRVWQNGGTVNLVLSEYGSCEYSNEGCNFVWGEGEDAGEGEEISFVADKGELYYVKCRDSYGNIPSQCTIIVRAL